MKNYDFKLKMKTLWVWQYSSVSVCLSHKAPRPVRPYYSWDDLWRPHSGENVWLSHAEALTLFSKLPKNPKELWQIKPNGEVIVWEWTP